MLSLLDFISRDAFIPVDRKVSTKTCPTGGEYRQWRTDYSERCQDQATRNQQNNMPITFEMLAREGMYNDAQQQITFPFEACGQTNALVLQARHELPDSGRKT